MNMRWLVIILCIILFIVINALYLQQHELAHVSINKYFGCENVSVRYYSEEVFIVGETSYNNCDPAYNVERKMMNALNEIVGYHVMVTLVLFFFMFFIFMLVYVHYMEGGKR